MSGGSSFLLHEEYYDILVLKKVMITFSVFVAIVKLLEVQPYQLPSLLPSLVSNQVTFYLARYTS